MKIKPQRQLEEYYVLEFFFKTGDKPDYEKWCKTISVHGLSPLKIEKVVKYAD